MFDELAHVCWEILLCIFLQSPLNCHLLYRKKVHIYKLNIGYSLHCRCLVCSGSTAQRKQCSLRFKCSSLGTGKVDKFNSSNPCNYLTKHFRLTHCKIKSVYFNVPNLMLKFVLILLKRPVYYYYLRRHLIILNFCYSRHVTINTRMAKSIAVLIVIFLQVSLDSRVRDVVNQNMRAPTPFTFDEAQTQIYTLMHRDSYPRFINSTNYRDMAQLSNSSNTGGGGSRNDSAT